MKPECEIIEYYNADVIIVQPEGFNKRYKVPKKPQIYIVWKTIKPQEYPTGKNSTL